MTAGPTKSSSSPEDDDVTDIHALILGAVGTPYDGGIFHFALKPPLVRLMTTDSGRVRFNLSFYENGKVCLALLGIDAPGSVWTRYHSIVPACERESRRRGIGLRCHASRGDVAEQQQYNIILQHETIRVAVCDMVEDCLRGSSLLPDPLKNEYEEVVRERLPMTGSLMNHAFDGGIAVYQYETLLTHVQDLRETVDTISE
ncbi:hypothetical protein HPB50_026262 [Hyalomma asiaticum]|uniref:Uncharacterized protein n=1 Tax=Hyalomma asiaticum TaxID=266040 RepID=A0ACB7SIW1_HYAAI|nr:hypothetical protein HPB50_026262 [Hyalomma asiaticum]